MVVDNLWIYVDKWCSDALYYVELKRLFESCRGKAVSKVASGK